jgi:hypothetical protein
MNFSTNDDQLHLVAVLDTDLSLATIDRYPAQGFSFRNQRFEDIGQSDCTGFFDWLRATVDQVIGVRYCLESVSLCPRLVDLAKQGTRSYLRFTEGTSSCVEVFFGNTRQIDPSLSCDQDWGGNGLFSNDELFAITFPLVRLSDRERNMLLKTTHRTTAESL